MIQSSNYKPVVLQTYGTGVKQNIDRVTDLSVGGSLNRTKRKELGTENEVGWKVSKPSVSVSMSQFEYGELDFFQALSNTALTSLTQANYKTSAVDILAFKTDDAGTFLGTTWYPKCRTSGFSINIGSPDDDVTRSFSLVGEDKNDFYYNNKYVIELIATVGSGETGSYNIVIGSGDYATYPDPVQDPDTSGLYIQRIVEIAADGTTADLVEGTDFTYTHGTTTINISAAVAGTYKVIYTAATYISGATPFTSNSLDLSGISADSVSVYLATTSDYIYRLQSVALDIAFTRFDAGEIGNAEVVQRGVRETAVNITLGRNLESYTLEEFLLGASANHGKVDIREYLDSIVFIIKFYTDKTKTTFKYGIRVTNLSPTEDSDQVSVDNYVTKNVTLQASTFTISTNEATING